MDASCRPMVVGKRDESGAELLPSRGELSPTLVARAIVSASSALAWTARRWPSASPDWKSFELVATTPQIKSVRSPFFCSGCPHNTSTVLPEGSRAVAGIGCHSMAMWMPARRTELITHMGAEGVNWIGQAPFTRARSTSSKISATAPIPTAAFSRSAPPPCPG